MDTWLPGRTLLVALLAALVGGCQGSPSAPTHEGSPPGPPPGPPPATVELKGRVVDDVGEPVAGATVAFANDFLSDPPHATTDGNGAFVFTASVPGDGAIKLPISIQHDGFDYVEVGIAPNSDTTITIYPTARIRSGSTLQTRIVSAAPYACGGGSHRCRRIVVEPAGDIVVVEILGTDGADVGLVDDGPPLPPFDYLRSVTVTDGEVYIIGGPAAVTLRARPSKETLVGQFTLTLTHGCLAVPEAARTRTYTASIDPAASGSVVTLGGAAFLMGPICTATASQLGCHQFLASREGDNVRFDLTSADEWHGGYITELIGPGLLEVTGSATGRVEASGDISAAGSGTVWHCTTYFPCPSSQYCEVTDLRLTFKRK